MGHRRRRLSGAAALSLTALATTMGAQPAAAQTEITDPDVIAGPTPHMIPAPFSSPSSPAFGKAMPAFLKVGSPAFGKAMPAFLKFRDLEVGL